MAAHKKYFNLPLCKRCEECGEVFSRPPTYCDHRWNRATLCSLSCASARGNRQRTQSKIAHKEENFSALIDRSPGHGPNGDCWLWKGSRNAAGYGRFGLAGKTYVAHRISLFGFDGYDCCLLACHTCDNPSCVRPDHLFAGTTKDNASDKVAKGRHRGNQRLTWVDVKAIRDDPRNHAAIAADYPVTIHNIRSIKYKKSWRGGP